MQLLHLDMVKVDNNRAIWTYIIKLDSKRMWITFTMPIGRTMAYYKAFFFTHLIGWINIHVFLLFLNVWEKEDMWPMWHECYRISKFHAVSPHIWVHSALFSHVILTLVHQEFEFGAYLILNVFIVLLDVLNWAQNLQILMCHSLQEWLEKWGKQN